jgi:hypothetical protein
VLSGAETLRKGADKVVEDAGHGDIAAWTYLRDTLDGKPAQAVTVAGDADNPLQSHVTVEIIRAAAQGTDPGGA